MTQDEAEVCAYTADKLSTCADLFSCSFFLCLGFIGIEKSLMDMGIGMINISLKSSDEKASDYLCAGLNIL